MIEDLKYIKGYTIFCDDIRNEVGGKLSYMGIYGNELIVNAALPAALPKLCLSIAIRFYRAEGQPAPMTLKVFVPWEDSAIIEAPLEFSDAIQWGDEAEATGYVQVNANLTLGNFAIQQEGYLKVRAYSGDTEYKLGALKLTGNPNAIQS